MTTPRQTRLLRVPALPAFHHAIATVVGAAEGAARTAMAVLVPTRASAEQLRATLAARELPAPGPALLTRAEWYDWLRARLPSAPRLLTAVEREALAAAAARDAVAEGHEPPFRLRPGLIGALLAFHDELGRYRHSVATFERNVVADLELSAESDRGARRLLDQTRFLVAACRAYERRVAARAELDEPRLRAWLIASEAPVPVSEVVVTVPDQVAHPAGLFPADFDLLARLPGLARVTLVATDAVLDTGYRDRLGDLLPELAEERWGAGARPGPVMVVPASAEERPVFVWRDREEELRGIARAIRRQAAASPRVAPSAAVVVDRPLPSLYLAPGVFAGERLTVRAGDGLPLAIEPYLAAVDVVLTFADGLRRGAIVELLRSPHFAFAVDDAPLEARAVHALDRAFADAGVAGGRTSLDAFAAGGVATAGRRHAAVPAARCALALADELHPLAAARPLAAHLTTLRTFLERHASPTGPGPVGERTARVRKAVWQGLAALEAASQGMDGTAGDVALPEVVATLRRWVEGQTLAPAAAGDGVALLDPAAAVYAVVDDLFVAGLVEPDWSTPAGRNIFYPGGMLTPLGWPAERDRRRAARAAFRDLLGLARERVWLSTFTLEDDAVVTASTLLEDLDDHVAERRPVEAADPAGETPVTAPPAAAPEPDLATRWRVVRRTRGGRSDDRFRGFVGRRPARTYAVSALERYLDCPFKYFARDALRLEEEPDDEQTMTPQQRGRFLHEVFESFFRVWQAAGERAITIATLDAALTRFAEVADGALARLPPVDRAVARVWLLGSPASPGLAERLFVAEVEDPTEVVERLLEYRIDGRFGLADGAGRRTVAMRGVVDRIDLHADATFRVIDYKAGRPPQSSRALQLPVYARCAERQLEDARGEPWRAADALYVAFGQQRLQVSVPGGDLARAMAEGEARVLAVVDAIESGAYPPRPADLHRCTFCPYPTVCRKDYVEEP